jgi:NDP-sugar pyrophosphorylase family protein
MFWLATLAQSGDARALRSRWYKSRSGQQVAHAAGLLQKRFLLLNGASFFDFNLLDLVWRAGSSLVHMALRADAVGDRSRHVVLDNDRVRAFLAPGYGAAGPAEAGVYVIDRSIIDGNDCLPARLNRTSCLRSPQPAP